MFQCRRSVPALGSFVWQSEIVNKVSPPPYTLFPPTRIFTSQYRDFSEITNIDLSRYTRVNKKTTLVKDTLNLSLQGIYDCSQEELDVMVLIATPALARIQHEIISSNAKLLKENGLCKNTLVSHPWVLAYNSQLFPNAIKVLKTFNQDINVTISLLDIPYKQLQQLANVNEKSKIEWMSELLKCDEVALIRTLARHNSVLRLTRDRILKVFNTLKDGGVALEDIVKDIGIFHHNVERMAMRLAIAKENGVTLKPWSLRCSVKYFERTIERKVKAREILGDHGTVKHYLTSRLNCEETVLLNILLKIPQLKHITVLKVKDLLDYLFEAGYCAEDVLHAPRILTRSKKTVENRIEELGRLGLTRPKLLVVCKTSREYSELITKLKHNQ